MNKNEFRWYTIGLMASTSTGDVKDDLPAINSTLDNAGMMPITDKEWEDLEKMCNEWMKKKNSRS